MSQYDTCDPSKNGIPQSRYQLPVGLMFIFIIQGPHWIGIEK